MQVAPELTAAVWAIRQSSLVLQLRRFQFLELVRTGRKQRALDHARYEAWP